MAKLPGHMKIEKRGKVVNGELCMVIRINPWHPKAWLMFAHAVLIVIRRKLHP